MRRFLIVATALASAMLVTASQAQSPPGPWTQVGGLSCQLAPSIGLIVISQQKMTCVFTPNQPNWPVQRYEGSMTNLGIDLGATAGGVLGWAVFSSTVGPAFGGLAGTYVGASGEATLGVGAGANVLIGGVGEERDPAAAFVAGHGRPKRFARRFRSRVGGIALTNVLTKCESGRGSVIDAPFHASVCHED